MTKAPLIKENISLGLAYSFRVLVHFHHGRETWQSIWQSVFSRHGAGEGTESSTSRWAGSSKGTGLSFCLMFALFPAGVKNRVSYLARVT